MTKKLPPEEKALRHRHPAGTKERVIDDLTRYVTNPDVPMVPPGIASALATTRHMGIAPSKLYEDKGHKVNAIRYLAARCSLVRPPKTHVEVFAELESFFVWCGENEIPITLGGFCVWCGVTQTMVNKIERDTRDPERSHAFMCAKECIRVFLEMSAYDSSLNAVLWFHTNKVSFGAVENQQVTVRVEDNTSEISESEYQERVILLQQGIDGVYREAD
jgi:hypothetical protein